MQHAERLTLAEMREFLAASNTLSFAGAGRRQIYGLIEHTLRAQQYLGLAKQDKGDKGVVRRYLAKIRGRGLCHINAVDTVTQWQVMGCCETISEAHLIPVLEAMLHQFPFRIRGFHSDNGSEFVNRLVEKLLNKLLVAEFTKSRSHRTSDNALVEGKNGAVVRKHIGHKPIAAEHAGELQRFYMAEFNP